MNIAAHILVFIIIILLPLISVFSMRRLRQVHDLNINRAMDYLINAAFLWFLALLIGLNWFYLGRSYESLGLGTPDTTSIVIISTIIILALILVRVVRGKILANDDYKHKLLGSLDYVLILLPRTRRDLRAFFLLSISAGICEEILYRGFLYEYLLQFLSLFWVVIISSILFGIAHSYQGIRGIPLTGLIGLALGLIYVYTGTLWASIALHAAIDMGYGYLSWLAMQDRGERDRHP
ncbi:MAG: CPBP family intramembrane metalloprotease [Gammaproteobacteria bacterium]|nr:CPBP family intramembrane metalloprotease [Gammaproteobacteria bacterium]